MSRSIRIEAWRPPLPDGLSGALYAVVHVGPETAHLMVDDLRFGLDVLRLFQGQACKQLDCSPAELTWTAVTVDVPNEGGT